MAIGSHQSACMGSDTWLTPPYILEALGAFELDPCAALDMPWKTARRSFTIRENGLVQPWAGRVWLNPPYGRELGSWMTRMVQHNYGTALIFARTETEAFFKYVWAEAAALLFLEGRLHFYTAKGERARHNSGAPSVLIAYGLDDANQLEACQLDGAFVPLACKGQFIFVAQPSASITWNELIKKIAERNEGPISLNVIYALVKEHPKAYKNKNWKAKVRQTIQRIGLKRVDSATYCIT